ncbi:MAG: DUF4249 domain-containing protein [Bacteroidales bacterium]|nr:DUF4249 domain-containing protein [Bacteroidales bacterium]
MSRSKNIIVTIFFVLAGLLIVSCEKVIDVDLNDANTQLVVDAFITDSIGWGQVRLSKTGSFYDNNALPTIDNATVKIEDSEGSEFLLQSKGNGLYENSFLKTMSGRGYTLQIDYNNQMVSSYAYTPTKVAIDSLSLESFDYGMPSEKPLYLVTAYFQDPPNESNYYRFRIFINGRLDDGFLNSDDKYFDGLYNDANLTVAEEGDTVYIEMYCVDKANYDYFKTIGDASSTDTPGNPISNIEGENAIGYFGAYTASSKMIVVIP